MRPIYTIAFALLVTQTASAQIADTWQFRWQKGQVLTYRVDHQTSVNEVTTGNKVETSSKLNLVKRWQVADVDAKGNALLNLTVVSMRHERTMPNSEVLLFDSENLEKSTPDLKEQMSQYVGKTLASIRVDRLGRVVEVVQGSAARYESEPPFLLILPGRPLLQGQGWKRTYQLILDPPHGTGEKHAAEQTFLLKNRPDDAAILTLSTQFPSLPESVADRIPFLQKQPDGQIVFDCVNGRMHSAELVIDKTLENHQGEGTSYRYRSKYTEQIVAPGK